MVNVLYLTSYKKGGKIYPIGGGGNFPVTLDLGPCVVEDDQLKFEDKMKVLREEISVAAKRSLQHIISLQDSSQIMSLPVNGSPSVPLLYYKE